MFDKLKELMKAQFNYELSNYAIYETHKGRSKIVMYTTLVFIVALILFILDVTDVFNNFMTLGLIIILLAVLIVAPYSLVKSKYYAIIVTPIHLIQRTSKNDFVVIVFDEITGFKVTKEGFIIKQDNKTLLLSTDLFKEEIDPIIDVLEAKGKTFDKEKDYMIRRINVLIEDNMIKIEDNEEMTESQRIYEIYHNEFPILTPGFLEEINFRNSLIEDALFDNDNVFLYLSTLEVKGGHPENTTFESLHAKDCLLVFEKIKFDKINYEDVKDKTSEITEFPKETEDFIEMLINGVIHEWKLDGLSMDMTFAVGVHLIHTHFTFDEAIVGWKEAK